MHNILQKLNFREDYPLVLLRVPESLSNWVKEIGTTTTVFHEIPERDIPFILIFVLSAEEIRASAAAVIPRLAQDAVLWFCYPKKSSKTYSTRISRDEGWDSVKKLGYDTVRLVSIDTDWSALRFRQVAYIRNRQRDASPGHKNESNP